MELTARSRGRYPTKAKTPVVDVCHYQNDGTPTITPAKFIERAEAEADAWRDDVDRAITLFLDGADASVMMEAARQIAADISRVCDRIKTGQLKASFDGFVERN